MVTKVWDDRECIHGEAGAVSDPAICSACMATIEPDHETARLHAETVLALSGLPGEEQPGSVNFARSYLDLHTRYLDLLTRCELAKTTLSFIREECKKARDWHQSKVRVARPPRIQLGAAVYILDILQDMEGGSHGE